MVLHRTAIPLPSIAAGEPDRHGKMIPPMCHSLMMKGTAEIKGQLWSFRAIGLSYQSLWFSGREVLKPNRKTPGYHCNEYRLPFTTFTCIGSMMTGSRLREGRFLQTYAPSMSFGRGVH